jgi:peptidyl-prolyl cis-trans isomerase-like 4
MIQSGDPTGTGKGGNSIFHLIRQKKDPNLETPVYFDDEIHKDLKHNRAGLLCMANKNAKNTNASQFYITTTNNHLDYLDGTHTIFGEVAEGLDDILMDKLNTAFTDLDGKPLQPIRVKHTAILFDPFEDDPLPGLDALIPTRSPSPINDDVDTKILKAETMNEDELIEKQKEKDVRSRAVVLEMLGDIESADQKPPDNVLFVCKLHPATDDKDLKLIFSKFGRVVDCEVVRDKRTGDSLCYAFIGFESKECCEEAYFKMENVLIDERRIHVDFSQSVAKLWNKHRRSKLGYKDKDDDVSYKKEKQEKFEYKINDRQHGGGEKYELVYDEDSKKRKYDDKRRDRSYDERDSKRYKEDRDRKDSRSDRYSKEDRRRDDSRRYDDDRKDSRRHRDDRDSRKYEDDKYRKDSRKR